MFCPHRQATLGINDYSNTHTTVVLTGCPVGQETDRTVPVMELKSLDGMMFVFEILT